MPLPRRWPRVRGLIPARGSRSSTAAPQSAPPAASSTAAAPTDSSMPAPSSASSVPAPPSSPSSRSFSILPKLAAAFRLRPPPPFAMPLPRRWPRVRGLIPARGSRSSTAAPQSAPPAAFSTAAAPTDSSMPAPSSASSVPAPPSSSSTAVAPSASSTAAPHSAFPMPAPPTASSSTAAEHWASSTAPPSASSPPVPCSASSTPAPHPSDESILRPVPPSTTAPPSAYMTAGPPSAASTVAPPSGSSAPVPARPDDDGVFGSPSAPRSSAPSDLPPPPPPPRAHSSAPPTKPLPGGGPSASSARTAPSATADKKSPPRRNFNHTEKQKCWQAAPLVPGRNPDRWRADIVGNPVCHKLNGKPGIHGFEYDHIEPYSKGGRTDVNNCQILQYDVNKAKGAKYQVDVNDPYLDTRIGLREMAAASPALRYGENELDLVEMAAYGSTDRDSRKCKVFKRKEEAIRDKMPPADIPSCGLTKVEDRS